MEKIHNCPNCGGFLNDFGRCEFCGSKIYDFCDIDVSNSGTRSLTYIRIRTDRQIILAPIRTNNVTITTARDCFPTIEVEFVVLGNITMQEVRNDLL